MFISLIAGLITGFIVSIPPLGPISFALISKGFKSEIKSGLSIASGAAFMDFIYCMIAFGGVSLFISLLPETAGKFYRENIHTIQIILTYVGCVIVVIYGVKIMRTKITFTDLKMKQEEKIHHVEEKAKAVEEKAKVFAVHHHVPVVDKSNHGGLFLMGVLLCLSSVTLPASWIAFVSYLKGYRLIDNSFLSGILFSAGAFLGTLFWFYTLLKLITGNKHRINPHTVNKLNISAGVILILLGIFLFAKASLSLI
jgi:arginine exporter protein ArgO